MSDQPDVPELTPARMLTENAGGKFMYLFAERIEA
jgi:hypothetical protein